MKRKKKRQRTKINQSKKTGSSKIKGIAHQVLIHQALAVAPDLNLLRERRRSRLRNKYIHDSSSGSEEIRRKKNKKRKSSSSSSRSQEAKKKFDKKKFVEDKRLIFEEKRKKYEIKKDEMKKKMEDKIKRKEDRNAYRIKSLKDK